MNGAGTDVILLFTDSKIRCLRDPSSGSAIARSAASGSTLCRFCLWHCLFEPIRFFNVFVFSKENWHYKMQCVVNKVLITILLFLGFKLPSDSNDTTDTP